jgi:hypothetical protein
MTEYRTLRVDLAIHNDKLWADVFTLGAISDIENALNQRSVSATVREVDPFKPEEDETAQQ